MTNRSESSLAVPDGADERLDSATVAPPGRRSFAERAADGDGGEYAVPDGDAPAARCPYCGRPFERERFRRLHVGRSHAEACTDSERAAYDAAFDAEADDLFRYQLKLVAGLVVLSFGFVYLYAVVLTV